MHVELFYPINFDYVLSDVSTLGRLPSLYAVLMCVVLEVAQASDVLMVASDALVLLMTWTKTRKIQKEAERMDLKLKLYMLLLRDG